MTAVNVLSRHPRLPTNGNQADDQSAALDIATERTKALMKEKGFKDSDIASFEFTIDDIEPFDRDEAVLDTERSFGFYSDG